MAECRALGIDPAKLGGRRAVPVDRPIIWPDMLDSVALFMSMATQWTWVGAGMAGAFQAGLKYEVIPIVAPSINVIMSPRVFSDLRTLESAALKAWNDKRG